MPGSHPPVLTQYTGRGSLNHNSSCPISIFSLPPDSLVTRITKFHARVTKKLRIKPIVSLSAHTKPHLRAATNVCIPQHTRLGQAGPRVADSRLRRSGRRLYTVLLWPLYTVQFPVHHPGTLPLMSFGTPKVQEI